MRAAQQGYLPAVNEVAQRYAAGDGVAQDFDEAAAWFSKATEFGDESGYANTARLHDIKRKRDAELVVNRKAVVEDAVRWNVTSAGTDAANAIFQNGQRHYVRVGGPRDDGAAFRCFQEAAAMEHAAAQYLLGLLYKFEDSLECHEKREEILALRQSGSIDIPALTDRVVAEYRHRCKSIEIADEWLLKAAKNKHAAACFILAANFADLERHRWLKKAVKLGYPATEDLRSLERMLATGPYKRMFGKRFRPYFKEEAEPEEIESKAFPFKILPAGSWNIEDVISHYKKNATAIRASCGGEVIWERIQSVKGLHPEECYIGEESWIGYAAYTFPKKGLALLECPIEGNATYVLALDEWEGAAVHPKQYVRANYKHRRLIHASDQWLRKVRQTLKAGVRGLKRPTVRCKPTH